jgi:DNA helicase II / ATP-dependent DNA helicase PcrA
MSVAYLEKLNPEQRRAVEHGVRENNAAPGMPLLVIAGAGSGKTNTLAHRVAHLIVNGADPRKILLMTFRAGPPPRWRGASSESRAG